MVTELLLPKRAREKLLLPSYIKLDMAFDGADSAKLYDKSRYRSHGTITGASWATGLHGKALDFNPATPSYVEIPASHTQLDFTSEDFSIIARINIDDLSTLRMIVSRGAYNTDGYEFRVNNTGELFVRTNQLGGVQESYSAAGDVVAETWLTIGLSRDGASIRLLKNGVDVTATAGSHTNPATCARSAKIGLYDDLSSYPFDGKVEFFRIFGGIALPASTHLAYHNALK